MAGRVAITDEEKFLCELLVRYPGMGKREIYKRAGYTPGVGAYILKKPDVKEYLEALKRKTAEQETTAIAEQAAKKIALSLDMADDRLTELLAAKRFNARAALVEKLEAASAMKRKDDGEAAADLAADMREDGIDEIPIEDTALLKAIESAYKRLGVGGNSTTVNLNNNTQVQVYQSKWKQPVEAEIIEAVPPSLPEGGSQ